MTRVRVEAEECQHMEQDRQIKEQFIYGLDNEGMQTKIMSEIRAKGKTDNVTSEQVLMHAKQEEASVIQIREAGQTDAEMMRTGTCRYCGSSHPPRRCPAYGIMCGEYVQVNHFSAVCTAPRWRISKREKQSSGQTNQVESNHFSQNYKSRKTCIEAKVSTITFYNSIDIRFELDTGHSKNYIYHSIYTKDYFLKLIICT